jgi:ribonuclease III family protein
LAQSPDFFSDLRADSLRADNLHADDSAVMPNVAVTALSSVTAVSEPVSLTNQQFASQLSASQISEAQLNTLAPVSLAYIGDAVFELYVRSRLLIPAQRIRDYHDQVVNRVKAEQQAQYVDILMPHLSDAEQDIFRRGRNATSGRHRRAAAQSYQKATGFETLLGFLYLSDQARLFELLNRLDL